MFCSRSINRPRARTALGKQLGCSEVSYQDSRSDHTRRRCSSALRLSEPIAPMCSRAEQIFCLICRSGKAHSASAKHLRLKSNDPDVTSEFPLRPDSCQLPFRIMAAAFSPIMKQGATVLPLVTMGITEASATRTPSTPRTRNCGSTTAARS